MILELVYACALLLEHALNLESVQFHPCFDLFLSIKIQYNLNLYVHAYNVICKIMYPPLFLYFLFLFLFILVIYQPIIFSNNDSDVFGS